MGCLFIERQTSYVFTLASSEAAEPLRPKKRRKISKKHDEAQEVPEQRSRIQFPALLNGNESTFWANVRQQIFEDSWASTEAKIQVRKFSHVT